MEKTNTSEALKAKYVICDGDDTGQGFCQLLSEPTCLWM